MRHGQVKIFVWVTVPGNVELGLKPSCPSARDHRLTIIQHCLARDSAASLQSDAMGRSWAERKVYGNAGL